MGDNIDASVTSGWNEGVGFIPVGSQANYFRGHLNGNDYVINNLYINRPHDTGVALFGYLATGIVENLGIINAQIHGDYYVGTLAGLCSSNSLIENCWASGQVTIPSDGERDSKSGGLLGVLWSSVLSRSNSDVNVTALSSRNQIGGLCGYLRGRSDAPVAIIENCYSTGMVTSNGRKVGGLLGDADGNNAIVSKCYSVGRVIGSHKKGLVGFNNSNPTIIDSYWDVQTSGCSSSYGGIKKKTAQMIQQGTFVNWDFENVWLIDEGQSYPYLRPLIYSLNDFIAKYLNQAIEHKKRAIKELDLAIENEEIAWNALSEAIDNSDYIDISKGDIQKLKSKIHLNINSEQSVKKKIETSIDVLADLISELYME